MRGLFNLASESRDWKIKIISELNYEFSQLHSGTLDPIIKSLMLTLLRNE